MTWVVICGYIHNNSVLIFTKPETGYGNSRLNFFYSLEGNPSAFKWASIYHD